MHIATLYNQHAAASALLARGADPEARSSADEGQPEGEGEQGSGQGPRTGARGEAAAAGATPLFLAAAHGHADLVALLLKAEAKVDTPKASDLATPLCIAAQEGHLEVVGMLLAAGADTQAATADGQTPLLAAAAAGHLEIAALLLEAGAAVTSCTALQQQQQHTHTHTRSLSPSSSSSSNRSVSSSSSSSPSPPPPLSATRRRRRRRQRRQAQQQSPLIVASLHGNLGMVCLLLEYSNYAAANTGLSREVQTKERAAAIMVAAQHGHADILMAILREDDPGANRGSGGGHPPSISTFAALAPAAADQSSSSTPSSRSVSPSPTTVAATTTTAGARPPSPSPSPPSALMSAAASGCTPIYVAAFNGHADAVACLASHGADLDAPNARDGLRPAYVAAVTGRTNVIAVLAQHGADLNAPTKDEDGDTPMHIAAFNGHLETVQMLAASGADRTALDSRGETPRDVAQAEGQGAVVRWLDEVAGWHPLAICAGCRLFKHAAVLLKQGLLTLVAIPHGELLAVACKDEPFAGSPPKCQETIKLMRLATAAWSPAKHFLYPAAMDECVRTVMLVSERLFQMAHHHAQLAAECESVPTLPVEIWLQILGMISRRDWSCTWCGDASKPLAFACQHCTGGAARYCSARCSLRDMRRHAHVCNRDRLALAGLVGGSKPAAAAPRSCAETALVKSPRFSYVRARLLNPKTKTSGGGAGAGASAHRIGRSKTRRRSTSPMSAPSSASCKDRVTRRLVAL